MIYNLNLSNFFAKEGLNIQILEPGSQGLKNYDRLNNTYKAPYYIKRKRKIKIKINLFFKNLFV